MSTVKPAAGNVYQTWESARDALKSYYKPLGFDYFVSCHVPRLSFRMFCTARRNKTVKCQASIQFAREYLDDPWTLQEKDDDHEAHTKAVGQRWRKATKRPQFEAVKLERVISPELGLGLDEREQSVLSTVSETDEEEAKDVGERDELSDDLDQKLLQSPSELTILERANLLSRDPRPYSSTSVSQCIPEMTYEERMERLKRISSEEEEKYQKVLEAKRAYDVVKQEEEIDTVERGIEEVRTKRLKLEKELLGNVA